MNAPTIAELLANGTVLDALEEAWRRSLPDDASRRHEEGGWVYADVATGRITSVSFAPSGGHAVLDLGEPPVVDGLAVVATFHTHPNPTAEGWHPGPSDDDEQSAWLLGVPCIIRADNGIYTTGPNQRRGGMSGGSGFPP
jgi:hypothetical protein